MPALPATMVIPMAPIRMIAILLVIKPFLMDVPLPIFF
jgi:hypothetical protein